MFSLESKKHIKLPTSNSEVQVYSLEGSEFRVIFCDVPGPLVSLSILVPTVSNNNKGLPHTLEHLIFCGAKGKEALPRGYLDNLAVRMCSTGTNAYTTDDHTCYELTTAGAEGMKSAFPVFMNHILNPTLSDAQFQTEVFHVDADAKHQGVVYCEMASRENTEADLLDLHLRKSVYENQTTYSFECGGLTKEIANLSNQEIKTYHQQFYHLNNITAIVCGKVVADDILGEFLKHDYLYKTKKTSLMPESLCPVSVHLPPPLQQGRKVATAGGRYAKNLLTSKTVEFPSEDEDVGSIGFAWRGPPSEDVYTIYALEILFRHLNDNPSSLLAQTFIERLDPLASDVDLEIKSHIDSPIFCIFSGVPTSKGLDDKDEDDDEEDDEDDEVGSEDESSGMDEDEEKEDETKPMVKEDLLKEGVFYEKICDCLEGFVKGQTSLSEIMSAIKRHRKKMQEALEDSPHELIAMSLIPDMIRNAFSTKSTLNDTRAVNGKPKVGLRLDFFSILDKLEKEVGLIHFFKFSFSPFLFVGNI